MIVTHVSSRILRLLIPELSPFCPQEIIYR